MILGSILLLILLFYLGIERTFAIVWCMCWYGFGGFIIGTIIQVITDVKVIGIFALIGAIRGIFEYIKIYSE